MVPKIQSIHLPPSTPLPARIVRFHVGPKTAVSRHDPLLDYEVEEAVVKNLHRPDKRVPRRVQHTLACPYDGVVESIQAKVQEAVDSTGKVLLKVSEPCGHDVQFHGVCVMCGKDMSFADSLGSETIRADLNISHSQAGLMVSRQEATRLWSESVDHLIQARKLSLVLDLDQTLLHATHAPSAATLLPRHDIVRFQLAESPTTYYVKFRPGLKQFLMELSKRFELHVYTMGTRGYAQRVVREMDPDGRLFHDRILTRDESGSMTKKRVERLFPVDSSMVIILDDRPDVWLWSENLICIQPYEFFRGVGDINAAGSVSNSLSSAPAVTYDQDARDDSLSRMLRILFDVHDQFFSDFRSGGDPQSVIPILNQTRGKVLSECCLAFSGFIPLDMDPRRHDLVIMATRFGARVTQDVVPGETTHLVAAHGGTVKVKKAGELGLLVVNVEWLVRSAWYWRRLPEREFPVPEPRAVTQGAVHPPPAPDLPTSGGQGTKLTQQGHESSQPGPDVKAVPEDNSMTEDLDRGESMEFDPRPDDGSVFDMAQCGASDMDDEDYPFVLDSTKIHEMAREIEELLSSTSSSSSSPSDSSETSSTSSQQPGSSQLAPKWGRSFADAFGSEEQSKKQRVDDDEPVGDTGSVSDSSSDESLCRQLMQEIRDGG